MLTNPQKEQFITRGYTVVPGLIPLELAATARRNILEAAGIDEANPGTWVAPVLRTPSVRQHTDVCRTPELESAMESLIGPHFSRNEDWPPAREENGEVIVSGRSMMPVLRYPEQGTPGFQLLTGGAHIDGIHEITALPTRNWLVALIYLSDVSETGGAMAVWPGSHRQVFEHWHRNGISGTSKVPQLDYAPPTPIPGQAGDVVLMHHLQVHSSTINFDRHIRVALNTNIEPATGHKYVARQGSPDSSWTPLDWTLRTDNL